jgi:hypothetical protein
LFSCSFRPDEPGEYHVTVSSEIANMAYRKRIFLNPIKDGAPAFIQAVADDSDNGSYKLGNYLLIIGDCRRNVTLEFALSSKLARKKARAKIERFAAVVNEFREHMIKELELIDKSKR